MTHYDPNNDPERRETIITETVVSPAHTSETVETVVVRESNTGWWIAGILGGLVLIAVLWILFARGPDPQTDEALLEAQMDAAAAQAQADAALIQGQVAGAQARSSGLGSTGLSSAPALFAARFSVASASGLCRRGS